MVPSKSATKCGPQIWKIFWRLEEKSPRNPFSYTLNCFQPKAPNKRNHPVFPCSHAWFPMEPGAEGIESLLRARQVLCHQATPASPGPPKQGSCADSDHVEQDFRGISPTASLRCCFFSIFNILPGCTHLQYREAKEKNRCGSDMVAGHWQFTFEIFYSVSRWTVYLVVGHKQLRNKLTNQSGHYHASHTIQIKEYIWKQKLRL